MSSQPIPPPVVPPHNPYVRLQLAPVPPFSEARPLPETQGGKNLDIILQRLDLNTIQTYTVATLPAAATAPLGFAIVTDATLNMITGLGVAPTGGGANIVPVFNNGTNWLII